MCTSRNVYSSKERATKSYCSSLEFSVIPFDFMWFSPSQLMVSSSSSEWIHFSSSWNSSRCIQSRLRVQPERFAASSVGSGCPDKFGQLQSVRFFKVLLFSKRQWNTSNNVCTVSSSEKWLSGAFRQNFQEISQSRKR